ncbi:hypothetical protein LJY25_08430 [Hymenobacter sp. BT175]|uniref:hypothetical protein n=1 Tax=Hymenobacter translucens TaxID=2886507 RepID=UPI001D0EDB35|nr:hypothetical protein [Hymenobacter translucens]MCC2546467.1 hypothetical protein [Hymenobacter translucens]
MSTAVHFSTLSLKAQWRAVHQLRSLLVPRLGPSTASLRWWRRAVLAADPLLEWPAGNGPALVRRGQALLERVVCWYLVAPVAAPHDALDEELLELLP